MPKYEFNVVYKLEVAKRIEIEGDTEEEAYDILDEMISDGAAGDISWKLHRESIEFKKSEFVSEDVNIIIE